MRSRIVLWFTMKRLLVVLSSAVMLFAAKAHEWRTGTLIHAGSEHWVSSSGTNTTGTIAPSGNVNLQSNESRWSHETYNVVVSDKDFEYFASRTLSFRWQHSPMFTENAPVKFAIEGDTLYLLEDHGREFKMHIEKRKHL